MLFGIDSSIDELNSKTCITANTLEGFIDSMGQTGITRLFVGSGSFVSDLTDGAIAYSIKGFATRTNSTQIDIFFVGGDGIMLTSGRIDISEKTFKHYKYTYGSTNYTIVSLPI